MDNQSSVKVTTDVSFRAWNGEQLTATLTSITYDSDANYHYYSITLLVATNTMQVIVDQQWFHMNPRIMLHDVQFEAEGDIELKLALSPAAAAQLAGQGADAEEVLRFLLDTEADAASLTMAELWFIVEATQTIKLPQQLQQQGQLKVGFQTKWRADILHLVSSNKGSVGQSSRSLQASKLDAAQDSDTLQEPSARSAPDSLSAQVEQLLEQQQLNYHHHNEQIIVVPVAGKQDSNWTELIRIEQEKRLVIFYAVFPFAIPPSARKEAAEELLNDNYDLLNGAFEMDSEDGELRFRTSLLCPGALDGASFQQLLTDHQQIMEHYIPVIREFIAQG